ncbi:MAG: hypothetical protein ACK5RJ_01055 [Burkholderiales bacterium]
MPGASVGIQFLSAEAGGRSSPIQLGVTYRPHFRVAGNEYLGVVFVEGPSEPVLPGKTVSAKVQFIYAPQVNYSALKVGAEFQVLEGSQVVGVGEVMELLQ